MESRAPDDCPHKSWEYVGEPYLALNAVIALGNSIPDSVRTSLSTRLLQFQDAGTWDYTNGMRGPDADTSASAIRALDRLGHTVDLAGLYTFKHRDSDLFNTFRIPGENMGLCFLPQSREKHFGVHPCVLPNIWMLLKERGQLIEIDHSILHRIHNKDGSWPSYFYVSPFYSTRLYTELLSTFDSECNKHLEETTDFLLRSEAGSSPVQTAEIAIALHHLRPIVKSRSREIDSRAKQLLKTLKSQQLGDGSWVGENIWTFLHRTHSQPAVGFDSFRVHSTSLCVQALRYWN